MGSDCTACSRANGVEMNTSQATIRLRCHFMANTWLKEGALSFGLGKRKSGYGVCPLCACRSWVFSQADALDFDSYTSFRRGLARAMRVARSYSQAYQCQLSLRKDRDMEL